MSPNVISALKYTIILCYSLSSYIFNKTPFQTDYVIFCHIEKFKTFVLLKLNILVVLNVTNIYSEYLLVKFSLSKFRISFLG